MNNQNSDNHTNLLLAVVLSMALLAVWQLFFAPQPPTDRAPTQQEAHETQTPGASPTAPALPKPAGSPAGATYDTRAAALGASQRVPIETPSLKGSLSLTGARIDDLVLSDYRETVEPNSPNVVLLSPKGGPEAYYAEHGWKTAGSTTPKLPDAETVWALETGSTLKPGSPVTLRWDNGEGLVFHRTFAVDDHYMFTVTDAVENKTANPVTLIPTASIWRVGTPHVQGYAIQHEGLIGVPGDAGLEEIKYAAALEPGGAKAFSNKTGGWLGITDKYWAAAVIPQQNAVYNAIMGAEPAAHPGDKERFSSTYALSAVTVAPGEKSESVGQVFAGAKQVHLLAAYTAAGIKQFDYLIDWGWFYFFTKPFFYFIDWLYRLFGNFGIAILAVTVVVKALFFPLASKSYESMAKMKKLQPEMEKLRERFKDDKARQQQELMALYKKENINPLAGCLPIIVQIPVFFALYKVLFITIDMRQAPFFGWIRDLSVPDPTSVFNLFGLLPFAVPDYLNLYFLHVPLHLGVWPLLMGLTMWLQMQLNPPQPDPTQQMIFNWMPVFFTFLFAGFPAGLVIYWTWNNILSLAQQSYIMSRQGTKVALLDNIKSKLGPVGRLPFWQPLGRGIAVATAKARSGVRKNPEAPGERTGEADAPATKPIVVVPAEMSRERALSVLGLPPGASRTQIKAAHRRRSKVNHERGINGSEHISAAELDKARDVLLGGTSAGRSAD